MNASVASPALRLALGVALSCALSLAVSSAIKGLTSIEGVFARTKEIPFEVRPGDRILVTALKGSLRITGFPAPSVPKPTSTSQAAAETLASGGSKSSEAERPGNAILRIRHIGGERSGAEKALPEKGARTGETADRGVTIRREDTLVIIEAKGPESRGDWESQFKDGFPEVQLEIEAPSVPLEAALREGTVQLQSWAANATTHVVDGRVLASKNEGNLRVLAQKGEVKVETHKGRLEVNGFNPRVSLANIDGDLVLENFAGDSAVTSLKGSLQLKAFSGATSAQRVDGGVDFELGRASLNVNGLDGSLRGQLDNGSVTARIVGEPEVSIESQEGGVSLNLAAGAGASVRLQTEEGNLSAPGSLASSKTSTQKFVTGRLGSGGKGSVFVRTKTGNVRLQ